MLQQAEYPGAIAIPTTNYFPKRNGYVGPLTIINHGTAGFASALEVARYFQTGPVSSHFVVAKDGTIYQCVSIYDSCWGEGGNSSNLSYWPKNVNGNFFTIGIEHHKTTTDNSEDLTEAQYLATIKLQIWLCNKFAIPKQIIRDTTGGISGHGVLDPAHRSAFNGPGGCPGTFQWQKLINGLTSNHAPLNHLGEVANIVTATQFEFNETWYGCGFEVGAEARYMTAPTVVNTTQPEQVDEWSDTQYKLEYGGIGTDQTGGVSIEDMHRLILLGGHRYHDIPQFGPNSTQESDISYLNAILPQGFPIAITVLERSMFDVLLGKNPYYWADATSDATHVVFATGLAIVNGVACVLIHDSANVSGDIYGVNQIRPQPRPYDINKIGIQWASVVVGDWLPLPPANWDPLTQVIYPTSTPIVVEDDVMPTMKHVKNPSPGQVLQAKTMWQSFVLPKVNPADPNEPPTYLPFDTDIAKDWCQAVYNDLAIGAPNGAEEDGFDWNMKPIRRQMFDGGWAEYTNNITRLFVYGQGELKYSD